MRFVYNKNSGESRSVETDTHEKATHVRRQMLGMQLQMPLQPCSFPLLPGSASLVRGNRLHLLRVDEPGE